MKALIWGRVSTDRQEFETQIAELSKQAIADGYKEYDLVKIGRAGASAIKQNELYKQEVEELLTTITNDKEINVVYVWEISRLARNEMVFYQMKDFIIKHHIQLICKTPSIKLFDDDGTMNSGAELTLALLITLAKQEMEIKAKRFARAKKEMAEQGRFAGGRIRFGYEVDKQGYFQIKEDEAEVVRLIYSLYLQTDMSTVKVWQEVKARGYNLLYRSVENIIKDTSYMGKKVVVNERNYPPIIDEDTFNRVQVKRRSMYKDAVKNKHYYFGSKILVCPICGRHFLAKGRQYVCVGHTPNNRDGEKCPNRNNISIKWFDSIIWETAKDEEFAYRYATAISDKQEYFEKIEILKKKIEANEVVISQADDKISRTAEAYIDGHISKEKRNKKIAEINATVKDAKKQNSKYKNEIKQYNVLMESNCVTEDGLSKIFYGTAESLLELNYKEMYEIVRRHIKYATFEQGTFNGHKCMVIKIYAYKGGYKTFYYRTHMNVKAKNKDFRVYTDMKDENGEYIPADIKLIRE